MNYILIKIYIILLIINRTNAFDSNMFPIIKKLFNKDICYNKCDKNYVSRSTSIKYSKNNYKMTNNNANLNLRNTTNVSKETLEFTKYLNNNMLLSK